MPEKKDKFHDILELYNFKGPNFDDTRRRVNQMWDDFFSYPKPKGTTFPATSKPGMIVLKNHVAFGFCPHHLLPVQYTFKIGYIPNKLVLGASKPLRIANFILRLLPIQEDIGELIAVHIHSLIDPKGIGIVVQGEHSCMRMRGVQSACCDMVTTYMTGCFLDEQPTREEFLSL